MNRTPRVGLVAAALALISAGATFSQVYNPTPSRESKLLVGFETQTTVAADPNEVSENRASINGDPKFVAEGAKSLKLDLTTVGGWHNNWFVIDLPQAIEIIGYQTLSMDVYVPLASLYDGSTDNSWFQFSPHLTTVSLDADADDLGTAVDVSNATALHLDLFVPDGNQPSDWYQIGFAVLGEGGEVRTDTLGFIPGQWNTLQIPLTADEAKMIGKVRGLYLLRNQGAEWNGPIYIDNLRAVVPMP